MVPSWKHTKCVLTGEGLTNCVTAILWETTQKQNRTSNIERHTIKTNRKKYTK